MKKVKVFAVLVMGVFFAAVSGIAYGANDPGTVKEEIASDKQAIKSQHDEIKSNAQNARAEEESIKSQIKEARQSGDIEKVKDLEAQLRVTHKDNVAEKRQDKKELHTAKNELRQDVKAARRANRARP